MLVEMPARSKMSFYCFLFYCYLLMIRLTEDCSVLEEHVLNKKQTDIPFQSWFM